LTRDSTIDGRKLAGLFPGEIHGWRPGEPDGFYDAATLYDLIDGGAEVYIALNVKAVASRRFVKDGGPDIIADIFDMATPADAFGAYRHDMREGEDIGVGRESEFLGSSLAFWKDRYFVSIVAFDESDAVAAAVPEIGRAIAGRIAADGAPPELVGWLPAAGLVAGTVHYFHDRMLFNRYYRFGEEAGENPLALDRATEGVIARYTAAPSGDAKPAAGASEASPSSEKRSILAPKARQPQAALIVIRYPSVDKARAAQRGFAGVVLPGADGEGFAHTRKDGRDVWAGAARKDAMVIVVLDAPSREMAAQLISAVQPLKPPSGEKAPEKDKVEKNEQK
jgi:hypothetical protein